MGDGGYAFPVDPRQAFGGNSDMTLRDYFAAKAMQGLLAHVGCEPSAVFPESKFSAGHDIAKASYEYADTMLKARQQ